MNAKKNSFFGLTLAALVLLFSSCGKENQQIDYNIGVMASQEYVGSQQMMIALLNTYFKSITDSLLIVDYRSEIDGAVVTYHSAPAETIKIDYSDWNIPDNYGHLRSGVITAVASPGFYDSLAVINLTFENFRYDMDTVYVESMTIKNLGKSDGVNNTYEVKAGSVYRIYSDTVAGGYTKFTMNQTFVRIKDPLTIYHSPDDSFRISGTISGVTSTGYNYDALIEEGQYILNQFSCTWAKLGPALLSLDSQVYGTFILFPGADTCVNRYTVDIEGNQFYFRFD